MLCLCKLVWLQFKNSWTEWHLIISPRVSTWQLLTCTRKNIVICQGQKLSKKGERFFTRSTVMHFSLLTGGLKIWSSYFGRNLLEIWTCLSSCCSCCSPDLFTSWFCFRSHGQCARLPKKEQDKLISSLTIRIRNHIHGFTTTSITRSCCFSTAFREKNPERRR